MDGFRPTSIEVAPLQADGSLYGFMLLGRWPNDTVEWARFLVLAVQMAAVPGLLPSSTVFRVREDLPEQPHPGAIGLVVAEGQLLGEHPLRPGHFAGQQPPGLDRAAPAVQHVGEHSGIQRCFRLCLPAGSAAPRPGPSCRLGRGGRRRNRDAADQQSRALIPRSTPTLPHWLCCSPPDQGEGVPKDQIVG